jgi:spore germination protein KB
MSQGNVQSVQIANSQLFIMLVATVVSYGHFIYVHLSYVEAGRDAWFCMIIGFLVGSGVLLIQFRLLFMYPNHSLVGITKMVFGNRTGFVVSIVYILFFSFVGSLTLREVLSFLRLMYPHTPYQVFLLIEIFLIAWVVRSGLEVVARTVQLLLPVLVVFGSIAAIATLPDKDPRQLLPVLDHDMISLAGGTLIYVMMFSELIVFGMMMHETKNPKLLQKHGIRTLCLLFIMYVGPVTGPIMVFGETLAQELAYPTYTEIQYIHLYGIIERLDVLGVFLWTVGSFLRISVFLFGATKGIGELMRSKHEASYALPTVLFTAGLTFSTMPLSRQEVHHFVLTVFPFIAVTIGYLIPGLTLAVALVRQRGNKAS